MNRRGNEVGSIITQKLIGQNEDTIAAIVENLQLGRLEDCIQQYTVLHNNLVSLAHELDNIPTEDTDAYQFMDGFPDELVRLDPLNDLLPLEEKNLPKLPLVPPCSRCHQNQLSAEQCRLELNHIEPSHTLSETEQDELFKATQLIIAKLRKTQKDHPENKKKRHYKRWDEEDRYTLEVAMRIFGFSNYSRMSSLFADRNESQIRHHIAKLMKTPNYVLPPLQDLLNNPPAGYHPPPFLDPFYKACAENRLDEILQPEALNRIISPAIHSTGASSSSGSVTTGTSLDSTSTSANSDGNRIVERQGKNNFADLVNIATSLDGVDKLLSYIDDLDQISTRGGSGGGSNSYPGETSSSYAVYGGSGYDGTSNNYSYNNHAGGYQSTASQPHHLQSTSTSSSSSLLPPVHPYGHHMLPSHQTHQQSQPPMVPSSSSSSSAVGVSSHSPSPVMSAMLPAAPMTLPYGHSHSQVVDGIASLQQHSVYPSASNNPIPYHPLGSHISPTIQPQQLEFQYAQSQPPSAHHGQVYQPHAFLSQPPLLGSTGNELPTPGAAVQPSNAPFLAHLPPTTSVATSLGYPITSLSTYSAQTAAGNDDLMKTDAQAATQAVVNPLLNQLQMIYGTTSLMEQYEIARLLEQKVNNEACAALQQVARQRNSTKQEKAAILMEYYKISGSVRTHEPSPTMPAILPPGITFPQRTPSPVTGRSTPTVSFANNPSFTYPRGPISSRGANTPKKS